VPRKRVIRTGRRTWQRPRRLVDGPQKAPLTEQNPQLHTEPKKTDAWDKKYKNMFSRRAGPPCHFCSRDPLTSAHHAGARGKPGRRKRGGSVSMELGFVFFRLPCRRALSLYGSSTFPGPATFRIKVLSVAEAQSLGLLWTTDVGLTRTSMHKV
jgi:hypothetical protein